MAYTLAHAAKDENRRYRNGVAGDQSNEEVYIRTWYSRPWSHVIRINDSAKAERVAKIMEDIANNNNVGYDQNQRNTLLTQAKRVSFNCAKIATPCETDCSAMVGVACVGAGVVSESVMCSSGNSWVTSNLRKRLVNNADVTVMTASKYLKSGAYLKRGDILLYEGHHVAVTLTNGANSGAAVVATQSTSSDGTGTLKVDGYWGVKTTAKAQRVFGTTIDGIVSNQDISDRSVCRGCETTSFKYYSNPDDGGSELIRAIQKWVGVKQDGYLGRITIKAMQKKLGTTQDGVISSPSQMVKAFQRWLNKQ